MDTRSGQDLIARRTGQAPTVIFVHVPKTGGMTMRQIIRRNYRPEERYELAMQDGDYGASVKEVAELPEERKRAIRILFGHTAFGAHETLPGPSTYVTMLRRPTSLALSAYHFIQRRERNWLHEKVATMSIEEFVESDVARRADNIQTRILAGGFDWFGGCTDEMLERAKRNIENDFSAVGLTERFDESVLLWGRTLGWRKLHHARWNVTPKSQKAPVPEELIRAIAEHNQFDVELYRFVSERFDRDLAAIPGFEEKLARYRRVNRLYPLVARLKPRNLARTLKRRVRGR